MAWFKIWDGLIKKTCKYLLHRYLGQFLEETLNLEQLEVDLYNGKATVKNVSLKVEALNDIFETQGWAVEVKEGHIGVLTVNVPWNALMTNDSSIEMSDVFIVLRPIKRQNDGTSMLESMWSSVSSSMQLAEECMKQNAGSDCVLETNTSAIVGLEKFAETLDNVLNRIKAKFVSTLIKLEYPSPNNSRSIAIVINLQELNYRNKTGNDKNLVNPQSCDPNTQYRNLNQRNDLNTISSETIHLLPTFAKHHITFNGLRLCTEEFFVSQGASPDSSQIKSFRETDSKVNINKINYSEKIPMFEIREQVEIHIQIKQLEEIPGPKIGFDAEFGPIYIFLSPRQVCLLLKIWDAFFEEDLMTSNSKESSTRHQVNNIDCLGLEKHHMTGNLSNHGNWASTIDEREITSTSGISTAKCEKYCDSLNSSMTSGNTVFSSTRLHRRLINMETYGEILIFNIRVAHITGVILQEDILIENNVNMNDCLLSEESQRNLLNVATKFFNCLHENLNDIASGLVICEKNHIYFSIAPIFSTGTQCRNNNLFVTKSSVNVTKFDICEVLEGKPTPLIYFDRTENCCDGYHKRPEVVVTLKSSSSCNLKEIATTSGHITLEKSTFELDITIYDRLNAILGTSPFEKSPWLKQGTACIHKKDKVMDKSLTDITIVSSTLLLKLRFPIIDARPIHHPERIPWWKQNIRTDFLLFSFSEFGLRFCLSNLNIQANEINVFYCENSIESQVQVLKSGFIKNENQSFIPKITIKLPFSSNRNSSAINYGNKKACTTPFSSERVCRESDTLHNKRDTEESEYILLPAETKELNNFCEATMDNAKVQIKINFPTAEITIKSKQLYEVLYNRLNTDLLMWEPSSPVLRNSTCQMDCKIYQTLSGKHIIDHSYSPTKPSQYSYLDEKLFETNDKHAQKKNEPHDIKLDQTTNNNSGMFSAHSSESIFFSTNQDNIETNNENKKKVVVAKAESSDCAIQIVIGTGSLEFFSPVRDLENRVLPEQSGKFYFKISTLNVFSVSGYNGDRNLSYVCIQLSDVAVYHCGILPLNYPIKFGENVPEFMKSTFYKIPNGLRKGKYTENGNREMFSLIIEIRKLPEKKIKRLRITTGVQGVALRHNPEATPNIWLNQMIDFLDVPDYPIEGYSPFGIITEIQLHVWDSAIDYRPNDFCYRAVLEFGSFTISSNIISSASGCNLRFIIEECVLSVAPFDNLTLEYPNSEITVIESSSLVPVFDIALFDISLWLNGDINNKKCPNVDLRCSIHDAHLRTCFDSGSALAQLVGYIAKDGDLNLNNAHEHLSPFSSSVQSEVDILSTPYSDVPKKVSEKQHELVSVLMAEAVQETVTSSDKTFSESELLTNEHGIEVYYFPDENIKTNKCANTEDLELKNEFSDILNFESTVMQTSYCIKADIDDPLPQIKADFGQVHSNVPFESHQEVTQEEDYCVIGNDEKQFMYQHGIRNIKIQDDPLRIVDNHFCLPTGKPDLLRPPDDFPTAVLRYTLCEMTFTWHLYGGKDFKDTLTAADMEKKYVDQLRMSEAYKYGVSYSKGTKGIHFNKKKSKEKLTWKTEGGCHREHEVLVEIQLSKVRFSHEVYPNLSSHASRQVLLISEIEVRDRLQISEINKFLYHPNLKTLSTKNSQHMVVIKALHVRPHPQQSTAKECSLRISLLPIRLHIDQVTLEFLADYFTNIGGNGNNGNNVENKVDYKYSRFATKHNIHTPVMHVDDVPEAVQSLQARRLIETNLNMLINDRKYNENEINNTCAEVEMAEDSLPIYFREVIFSPEVRICLDYHGRHVELSRGPVAGLLMGLGQLRCSEIRLQKLICKHGILGVDKLLHYLCKEWLRDIKRNQLSKILSGVGPTHAFVQLFQGIYDLFWLPIEQYQKDGRLIKGLQLGAQSFTACTALAALELTSRIIHLLQFTAETAFDMVSPGPSIRRPKNCKRGKKRPHRPKDIREGVTNAYIIVKEGINESANTLLETTVAEHDQKGYTGAVGAIVRHIPQLVVCPAMLATQATTNILGGVKSSLLPDAKIEAQEKWKDDSN